MLLSTTREKSLWCATLSEVRWLLGFVTPPRINFQGKLLYAKTLIAFFPVADHAIPIVIQHHVICWLVPWFHEGVRRSSSS